MHTTVFMWAGSGADGHTLTPHAACCALPRRLHYGPPSPAPVTLTLSPQLEGPPDLTYQALVGLAHLRDLVRRELERLRDGGQRVVEVTLLHVAHEHVLDEGEVDAALLRVG